LTVSLFFAAASAICFASNFAKETQLVDWNLPIGFAVGAAATLVFAYVAIGKRVTVDGRGLRFWLGRDEVLLPWDRVDAWRFVDGDLSSEWQSRIEIDAMEPNGAHMYEVHDYEVQIPGFPSFLSDMRRYAGSKEVKRKGILSPSEQSMDRREELEGK
jgi:hypothetical protein